MLKLLFSAYAIIILPYITTMYSAEFLINKGFIAKGNSNNLVDAFVLVIILYIIEQLAATALIKRFVWKR